MKWSWKIGEFAGIGVYDAFEMLETVSARLQECSCHTLPVLRQGQLVGLVTMENIGEFLMIQGALNAARR